MRRVLGLLASASLVVAAAIVAWRPSGDVGYIEIKTLPVAPVTHTLLYIDSTKLAPIRKGSAILQQRAARSDYRQTTSPGHSRRSVTSW